MQRIPATQGFIDGTLAGLGWAVNPVLLAREHIEAGGLVSLLPGVMLEVRLYWQCARLGARLRCPDRTCLLGDQGAESIQAVSALTRVC